MKELNTGCWLQLFILIPAIALAAFLIGVFTEKISHEGFFGPVIATDTEVIHRIEGSGIILPKGASRLAYLQIGFEEPIIWISLELPAQERTAMAAEWLARAKVKQEPISAEQIADFDPTTRDYEIKSDLSRFAVSAWKRVRAISARDPAGLFEYAVFEDLDSDRLLLYRWSE